jgi:hypothetical protein
MMITMWVDGQDYEVPADQVIPWVCGIHGVLDTIDLGLDRPITVDVDPAASDRPGTIYIIEIDGVRHDLAESWVLPWMRGLAIRNGIADQAVCDPSAAERAQRVQALMVGHQFGLFTYTGFTTHKKEATT